jgi:hypothetical protein
MAIPESQLNTWSHQGSITNSANTGNSVKNALDAYTGFPDGISFDVYLSGSYKNDTNVYGESDVDVVVELTSSFQNNLTQDQKNALGFTSANYSLSDFRTNVEACISTYYGTNNITIGNKVITVNPTTNRLEADVLVCSQYRLYYGALNANNHHKGIIFTTRNTNQSIINFPKKHSDNATIKHQGTNQWFKPTVRIFKNMRNHLVNNNGFQKSVAQSYFIECMLSNIPNNQFGTNYQATIINCHNYLTQNSKDNFMSLNGVRPLWGNTTENWNQADADNFLQQITNLWNNW